MMQNIFKFLREGKLSAGQTTWSLRNDQLRGAMNNVNIPTIDTALLVLPNRIASLIRLILSDTLKQISNTL